MTRGLDPVAVAAREDVRSLLALVLAASGGSQHRLAGRAAVNRASLSHYLAGTRDPSAVTVAQLAAAAGVGLRFVLDPGGRPVDLDAVAHLFGPRAAAQVRSR